MLIFPVCQVRFHRAVLQRRNRRVSMHLQGAPVVRVHAARVRRGDRQSPLGIVDPSVQALSGRLKFTVRRHKFNADSLSGDGLLFFFCNLVIDLR